MASKLNVNRGTTYSISVAYKRNSVPTTLVGATVRFTIKSGEFDDNFTDTSALLQKNVTNGNAAGLATITLLPADTQQIEPGKYFYDVKVQNADGTIYKLDEGQFILDGSPTNRLT